MTTDRRKANDEEIADMSSEQLARYIADRFQCNNYAEARRATLLLLVRQAPEPRGEATVVERMADAIVLAHLDGQSVGEKRYEKPLRELFRIAVMMDAEAQADRPEESAYQRAMKNAARVLGEELPAPLLAAWARELRS